MVCVELPLIARGAISALVSFVVFAGCGTPATQPRLIVLITVDTLRADRLGAYGSDRDLTPNLDELAARSQIFEAAYAPAPFTLPSISALLTGRYPEEIGMVGNRSALSPTIPTIASRLRERGWRTAAVVGNLVLRRNAGLAGGFDHYDDEMSDLESVRHWPERIAADTTDAALALLAGFPEKPDDRLFLWVHYQDPHGPYTPPVGLRERFLDDARKRPDGRRELETSSGRGGRGRIPAYQVVDDQREIAFYRAGYDAEVHYFDTEFGRLLARLDDDRLDDESIVVFTADHGESLGEHDYWFAHGDRLDDPLVRVPLMLRVPGLAPRRRPDIASLMDLHPTLMHVATGEPSTPDPAGRDLLAADAAATDSVPYLATLSSGGPIRYGIVADGHKFVMTRGDGGWRKELFRIGRESENLAQAFPDRTRTMFERLVELRSGLEVLAATQRQRLSARDQQNLRALGYIEDPEATEPGWAASAPD